MPTNDDDAMTFPIDPPITGNWTPLQATTAALLGERLYDFGAVPRSQPVGPIRAMRCPFNGDYLFCDVALGEPGLGQGMVCFLYGRDGVRKLTGASEVIHAINAQKPPDLSTRAREAFYLQFFCLFVQGGDGPFEVLLDAATLAPGDFDATALRRPEKNERTGLWTAFVLYGKALFRTEFAVQEDGHVRMESDEAIAQGVTRQPDLVYDGPLRRLRAEDD